MLNNERIIKIASDAHGVLFRRQDPKELPSAVKVPLQEQDLQSARIFDREGIARGLYYAYITPVGLSERFRMTADERDQVKIDDKELSPEQNVQQAEMFKRDFLDNYEKDPLQTEAARSLVEQFGLNIGVISGTPGFLHRQAKDWLREQGLDEFITEVFLNRNRSKGPTLSKLVTLRLLNPKIFIEDSLYTALVVACELNWVEVHNPLSFDEAWRREVENPISVKSSEDMPDSLKTKALDLMIKKGGDRIKFSSGFPEILAQEQSKKNQGEGQKSILGLRSPEYGGTNNLDLSQAGILA